MQNCFIETGSPFLTIVGGNVADDGYQVLNMLTAVRAVEYCAHRVLVGSIYTCGYRQNARASGVCPDPGVALILGLAGYVGNKSNT